MSGEAIRSHRIATHPRCPEPLRGAFRRRCAPDSLLEDELKSGSSFLSGRLRSFFTTRPLPLDPPRDHELARHRAIGRLRGRVAEQRRRAKRRRACGPPTGLEPTVARRVSFARRSSRAPETEGDGRVSPPCNATAHSRSPSRTPFTPNQADRSATPNARDRHGCRRVPTHERASRLPRISPPTNADQTRPAVTRRRRPRRGRHRKNPPPRTFSIGPYSSAREHVKQAGFPRRPIGFGSTFSHTPPHAEDIDARDVATERCSRTIPARVRNRSRG